MVGCSKIRDHCLFLRSVTGDYWLFHPDNFSLISYSRVERMSSVHLVFRKVICITDIRRHLETHIIVGMLHDCHIISKIFQTVHVNSSTCLNKIT